MKNIVLVDDSPDQIELMMLALRSLGVGRKVTTFASGEECLAAIERGDIAPALVMLDVNMPGLDGPDTAARLRRLLGRSVPIVMMSTSDRREDVRRGMEAGADSYVMKPTGGRTWREVLGHVTAYWLSHDLRAAL